MITHIFLLKLEQSTRISFDRSKNNIFVSNWYDDVISVIDFVTKRKKHEIKVGQSPAGIYFDKNQKLYVANRESNNVSVIDTEDFEVLKSLNVENSPFGVYSEDYLDYIVVTNIQLPVLYQLLKKKSFNLLKNINVGKWPYSVVHDKKNNNLYITNQRDDSISIINMDKKKMLKHWLMFANILRGLM